MKLLRALLLIALAAEAMATTVPADFRLTLERGPCYGSCPIYSVTVDANGTVIFDGKRFTSVVGERRRAMTIDDVKHLVRAAQELEFFTLGNYTMESMPGKCWTDMPTASITIRMNGHTKTVDHNFGCKGFDREKSLIAFERRIDELTGAKSLAEYDRGIEVRRRAVATFGDGCKHGVDCEQAAARLAQQSLLLFDLLDASHDLNRQLRIDRDGSVRLKTQRIRFVHEVRSTMAPDRLRELTARMAPLPMPYRIPLIERPPDELSKLADDRTWTDHAKSIRIEVVPTDRFGDVEPWPAEDIAPLAQLTKRTFTAAEWRAIAARLGYPEHKFLNDYRMLDGKPFGSTKPVYLRLIAAF